MFAPIILLAPSPQIYRQVLERTTIAAEKIKAHKLTQNALAATADQLAALQVAAAKASQAVAQHVDAAVAGKEPHKAAAAAAAAEAEVEIEAAAAAAAALSPGDKPDSETFADAGEAAEAAAAAAAGDIVNLQLFAPGRLLYVRPVDELVPDEQQKFELVDGHGGECCRNGRGTRAVLLCVACDVSRPWQPYKL